MRSNLAPGVDAWGVSLRYLMGAVVASGGVLLGTYNWMQRKVVKEDTSTETKKTKKKKVRMGLKDSAKFLMSSSYIRNLATLVISYGMCINLVEVSWKSKIKVSIERPHNCAPSRTQHTLSTLGGARAFTLSLSCSKPFPIPTITLPLWVTFLP